MLKQFNYYYYLSSFPPSLPLLPPVCIHVPPLGAPGAPSEVGANWKYPSILHWRFGVMYVGLGFCFPHFSLLYF